MRRQPSDGGHPVLTPTTGTLGVVPVPWARLHSLGPKLKAHPEQVYSATKKAKVDKGPSPLQQLALRTSKPAAKVAEPKPKAVHIKIEGEERKPKASPRRRRGQPKRSGRRWPRARRIWKSQAPCGNCWRSAGQRASRSQSCTSLVSSASARGDLGCLLFCFAE